MEIERLKYVEEATSSGKGEEEPAEAKNVEERISKVGRSPFFFTEV